MTKLLEQAFAAISKLPEPEQDSIAASLFAELEFDSLIASAPETLSRLAAEARAEIAAGLAEDLDPKTLGLR